MRERLLTLIPIGYIIFWLYLFFTWIIPSLSVPIGETTWWGIISVVLYFCVGGFFLVLSFIALWLAISD